MNDAVKYFQKNGLQRSKELVEMGFGFCSLEDGLSFHTEQLKQIVESHELVNEFFNLEALGFDKAIELAKKQIEELEENETVEFWHRWDDDLSCTVARMKQAIADVESCMEVS